MRQRAMIAMALACNPVLLIADEPTTALDVTTQAQILDLMRNLQDDSGMAIMLITHDLGVVAEMCDEVAVMYLGRVVEQASVDDIFHNPKHPYTKALLRSIPRIDGDARRAAGVDPRLGAASLPPADRLRLRPALPIVHARPCDAAEPALSARRASGTRPPASSITRPTRRPRSPAPARESDRGQQQPKPDRASRSWKSTG